MLRKDLCGYLLVFAVLPWAPLSARAEDKVQVTVLAILATDQNKTVDPELKCIATKVQKLEPSLTGFRVVRTSVKSLAVGKLSRFPLVESVSVQITVEQGADKDHRMSLIVKPPQQGEISYICCCAKYFPIVTRYQTVGKERLIIAIMVDPCGKR